MTRSVTGENFKLANAVTSRNASSRYYCFIEETAVNSMPFVSPFSISSQPEDPSSVSNSESDSDAFQSKKESEEKSAIIQQQQQQQLNFNSSDGLTPATEDKTQDSNVSSVLDPACEENKGAARTSAVAELTPSQCEAMEKEIWDLALKLLESWKDLKEVFKIPKIMHRERREHEKDLDAKRDSLSRSFRDGDAASSSTRSSRDRRGNRSVDREGDRSSAGRYSSSDRKRKHSPESARDSPKDAGVSLSRTLSGPAPNKLSKYEHRRLFEEKVKLEDTLRERQKLRQQQQQHQMPMPPQQQEQLDSMQHQPPLPQQLPPLPQSQPPPLPTSQLPPLPPSQLPQSQPPLPPPQQQQPQHPPQMWGQEGWNCGNAAPMQAPYQGGMPPFQHFMPPTGPPPSGPPPMSGPPPPGPIGNFPGQSGFFPPGGGPPFQNQPQYQEPAEPVMIPVVGKFVNIFFSIIF